ncbi:MAG: HEAT repeat domain-containing protein [Acidobacteriia bacterium]|nr:HEAT repeat domain-containing protein [Terriglobia bacterium]
MASVAAAQTPHIRDIDFYGLQKIAPEKILRALKLQVGDALPGSKGDLEDQVAEISGVVQARVEAVCCEGPDISLFIGIEEKGGPHVAFRSAPAGDATLPEEVTATYHRFQTAGKATLDSGIYPEQFTAFAGKHLDVLRQVLRTGSEPEERAIAAAVLEYAPNHKDVIADLQYALQDPEESVRANGLHALGDIAVLGVRQPKLGLKIAPTWFIELLNSAVLNDRMQATDALITLTDGGDRTVLDQMRERALPALAEMARWPNLRYALRPFLLVGRLAGLTDEEAQRRWSAGEREPVIAQALGRPGGRRKAR